MTSFHNTFLWGAAISAHAVEGGHFNSDWWHWEQRPGRVAGDATSRTGADHVNRWAEDVALAKKLSLNALVVSLEWSQVEPEPGQIATEWLDHYGKVVRRAFENGLAPIVLLQDRTLPQWLAEEGGWAAQHAVRHFAAYAQAVVEALQPWCRHWIPLGNPMASLIHGPLEGLWPPGRQKLNGVTQRLRTLVRIQRGFAAAVKQLQPDAQTGLSAEGRTFSPAEPGRSWDHHAARRLSWWWNRLWPEAVLLGRGLLAVKPAATSPCDFLTLHYAGHWLARFQPFHGRLQWAEVLSDPGMPTPGRPPIGQPNAASLRAALGRAATWDRPILLMMQGDPRGDDARCHQLLDATATLAADSQDPKWKPEQTPDILGLIHDPLLDGFEWIHGHAIRRGLVHVERDSFARTPGNSAFLLKALAESNGAWDGARARFCPAWAPPWHGGPGDIAEETLTA